MPLNPDAGEFDDLTAHLSCTAASLFEVMTHFPDLTIAIICYMLFLLSTEISYLLLYDKETGPLTRRRIHRRSEARSAASDDDNVPQLTRVLQP